MAWKGRGLPTLDFSVIISTLNNSTLQKTSPSTYQVLFQLLSKIQTQRDQLIIKFKEVADNIFDIGNTIINTVAGLKDATFWTRNDETLFLPSSLQVIAGVGITLDYTVPNKVTVSVSGGSGTLFMVIGEPVNIMSDGTGNPIVLPFTLPTEIP